MAVGVFLPGNAGHRARGAAAMLLALCTVLISAAAGAQSPQPPSPAQLIRIIEVVEKIKREYVAPVDDGKLAAGCRAGMLGAVDPAKRAQLAQAGSPRSSSITDQFLDLFGSIAKQDREAADEAKLTGACLRGMTSGLDPLSAYMDEEEFRELQVGSAPVGGLGLELRIDGSFPVVVAPIENSPAERARLGSGDVLVAIDSVSTRDQSLPDVVKRMRGPVGSRITLTITRKDGPQPVVHGLVRDVVRIQSVRWKTLAPGYAYIRVAQFQEATGALVAQAFESVYQENRGDLKGLILDLRDNTGGLLNACVAVAAVLLPRGTLIASINGRTADSTLRLTASPEYYIRGRTQPDYVAKLPPAVKTVPMAVLVNGSTASGSEMVATALQYHKRARIFGTRTFENGVIATIFPLSGNTALKLTTASMFGPGGSSAVPVIPDVELEQGDKYWRAYASPEDVQLVQVLKTLGGQP